MQGKLIVLDGLDGSGKSTQAQILANYLSQSGKLVELLSYPDYNQPSSALVKLYLNGALADSADAVNAYAASSFYAVDRYASYMQFWKDKFEQGINMIASRYVSSNAIHQMGKLPKTEWDHFLEWLDDFEYNKLDLPRPDQVIFLDMSREVADQLILSRYHGDSSKKDLHEQNMEYMQRCMESAHYAAEKQHWKIVRCCDGKQAFPVEQIAQEIMKCVKEVF